jgi:hypothetical protein
MKQDMMVVMAFFSRENSIVRILIFDVDNDDDNS